MTKEEFANERDYQLLRIIARSMLGIGLIKTDEYNKIVNDLKLDLKPLLSCLLS